MKSWDIGEGERATTSETKEIYDPETSEKIRRTQ